MKLYMSTYVLTRTHKNTLVHYKTLYIVCDYTNTHTIIIMNWK